MKFLLAIVTLVCVSCSHTYYVVRHAEKEAAAPNMSSDVPLSREGKERTEKIKEILKTKKIRSVYSTNTIRTKSTAQRTADYFSLPVIMYGPRLDSTFTVQLRAMKSNVLIVGHSNTVDDIVNALCKEKKLNDLDDSEYNKLFIVTYRGKKIFFMETEIFSPTK
ncbi:MAG: phosphoglycerate mutase family protein [Chitinophagaceae bacterium]